MMHSSLGEYRSKTAMSRPLDLSNGVVLDGKLLTHLALVLSRPGETGSVDAGDIVVVVVAAAAFVVVGMKYE